MKEISRTLLPKAQKPVQTAIISLVKDELTLKMREWLCPNCQVSHDRDLNASINILNNATVILTAA